MRTIHLVSHTHWDREWYLTFQQFRLKLVYLIDSLLEILECDPQYRHFMLDGQTIVLEDYLAIRPEREEELREYIRQGRILIGPWYILPDEFLVSPEAHIRNLLEGDRVARRFGPKMMVGYIPDTFGHIGQMPQILRGFGLETAVVWRGMAYAPCEILWESPDGSRVLTANLRDSYSNAASILNGGGGEAFAREVCHRRDTLAPHAKAEHILLMHGTDHMLPQPETTTALRAAEGLLDGDRIIHSTLPAYLEAVRAGTRPEDLPVITGELRDSRRQQLLPGVLSTRVWIKQRNHACETLLEKWAEPFSTVAELIAADLPGARRLRRPVAVLREAWRLLMQCHPHDSICGCSIDQVHEEMRPRFDQVEQMGEEITRQSLEALAAAVDTHPPEGCGGASAVVVFNPNGAAASGLVSAALYELPESGAFELVDEQGRVIPHQSQGLGGQEMVNVVMDRTAFRDAFLTVDKGVLAGMRIQKMEVSRDGDRATIEAQVSLTRQVNMEAWEKGREAVEALLADPAVKLYAARAYSEASAEVVFTAPDVPAFGMRTFWVRPRTSVTGEPAQLSRAAQALAPLVAWAAALPVGQQIIARLQAKPAAKRPYQIENEFFRVEAQPDGTLDVLDKTSGGRFTGLNRFVDGGDRGDEYNYSPPEKDRLKTAWLKGVRVEEGCVTRSLVLDYDLITPESLSEDRKARSQRLTTLRLTSRVTLAAGVRRVDVQTTVENHARDHRLRVHFPAPFAVDAADYDGHFAIVRRKIGLPAFDETWAEHPRPEAPQRAFTLIDDGRQGLLIANRGLREVEVLRSETGGTEIALTLLRCVGWLSRDDYPERLGHAGPGLETPGAQLQGTWTFDYAIVPFGEGGRQDAIRQAYAFQSPLRAVGAACHPGALARETAFIECAPESFTLSAVKWTEDGQGWLLRGYHQGSEAITLRIKTCLPFKTAWRASLSEERQEQLAPDADGSISLPARGHEVVTVRFDL